MSKDPMQTRIDCDLQDLTKQELLNILESLRMVREESGWGSVEITIKGGEIDEVKTVISRRSANLPR